MRSSTPIDRLLVLMLIAGMAGSACAAQPSLLPSSPPLTVSPTTATPVPSVTLASPTVAMTESPSDPDVFTAMLEAINSVTPPFWRIDLQPDRLDGDWRLDGDVDDGLGPGRLHLVVTARPGTLLANPCLDPEFRHGATCTPRRLANGDLLVLRDVVEANGTKTLAVVLVHPDRSGVEAEAANFEIGSLSPGDAAAPTRADPIYSLDQLARLVIAVDEGTRAMRD